MWEIDPDNQAILHFSDDGGRFFLAIGKVLCRMHTEKNLQGICCMGFEFIKTIVLVFLFPVVSLVKPLQSVRDRN